MQFILKRLSANFFLFLLLLIMPLCAIAGNLAINLNITLVALLGIFLIIKNKRLVLLKKYSELLFLLLFFIISFFIVIYLQTLIPKSFLIIKFLFFTVSIIYFLENNRDVVKKIFIFYSLICLVLAIDVIFQSYFSINILGFKNNYDFNSSFYGEEKLAGFHILFFSFFTIFFIPDVFKKEIYKNIILILILIIIPLSIYLSLNRISILMYLFGLLIFFFLSEFRKKILIIISLFAFVFLVVGHPDQKYIESYKGFFTHGSQLIHETLNNYSEIKANIKNKESTTESRLEKKYTGSGHAVLFSNAFYIWNENKIIGVGYKQFYQKCLDLESQICSTHPHNIYLDILVSFGILGILPLIIVLLNLFVKSIKIIFFKSFDKKIIYSLFLTNIIFFFPLQSSGSILKSYLGFFAFTLISYSIFVFNNLYKKK